MTISTKDIAPASHPWLKLFIGADIVGSTAYKQPCDLKNGVPADMIRWSRVTQDFYRQVPDLFLGEWNALRVHLQDMKMINIEEMRCRYVGDEQVDPRLWKTVGDEVILWKTLTHEWQIWTMLGCWMRVLPEIRKALKKEAPGLDIKSTAWLAGFPVRNKALWMGDESTDGQLSVDPEHRRLPEAEWLEPGSGTPPKVGDATFHQLVRALNTFYDSRPVSGQVDFIGPGIDVGFRLGQWASAQRFVVSLDVAYLLAATAEDVDKMEGGMKERWFSPGGPDALGVHFEGTEFLRGVLGGLHYPRFWIDTLEPDTLEYRQAQLNPHLWPKPAKWRQLKSFCEEFYDRRATYLFRPFINDERSKTEPPEGYETFYREMAIRRHKPPSSAL